MKRILSNLCVSLLLAGFGIGAASAQTLTLQQAVEGALSRNVDYQSALLATERAKTSQSSWVNWQAIGVSATQKQSTDAQAPTTTTYGLTLPLFDQLGATAQVDQTGAAQVSVTANPLAHSDTAVQAQIAYDKAVLTAAQARVTLENSVRKAWLAQASAQSQLTVQTQTTALKETAYQDAKARYDKGSVTLNEVRLALKDWTEARGTQTTLDRALVKAKAVLAALLQTEAVELAPLDAAGLQALVASMGAVDRAVTGDSTAVKVQALEVKAQQAKADAVWLLDPSLAVAAGAQIPVDGKTIWTGSVTLSLTLGSWQGADKAVANRAAELARQSLAAQSTAARSSELQALLAVESAQNAVESRNLGLIQAKELLQETQLLSRAGKATALEMEDATLGVTAAENDLFQAWADVYGARLDLEAARS